MLTDQQIKDKLAGLAHWRLTTVQGTPAISTVVATGNFMAGVDLVNQVAPLAEKANHHPDVLLSYPRVTLTLTTHDAGGLTEKDFALAAEIDRISPVH